MRTIEEFFSKVTVPDSSGCEHWTGAKDGNGYGSVNWMGRVTPAHRIAYQISKGEIPKGRKISWTCKQKTCMTPEHLLLKENKKSGRQKLVSKSVERRLRIQKEHLEKIPLIVPDLEEDVLDREAVFSLLEKLTDEIKRLKSERHEAVIQCAKLRRWVDIAYMGISSMKKEIHLLEQGIIETFRDEGFKKIAELGDRYLDEETRKEEDKR